MAIHIRRIATTVFIVAPVFIVAFGASSQAATPAYSRDIQSVFAQKCLNCHGPDSAESGLRLDLPDNATQPADSGETAVVPGDAYASEILARITSTDPEMRMPPEGEPLTESEIESIRQWINAGAEYDQHWAYRPIAYPTPPSVEHDDWVRNEIDRFVLAKLKANRIEPSPVASRYTLIKRLAYDLHGIPPTVKAVDAFVNDTDPDAYERLVTGMLSSHRFAERWARHWLDKARYADSDGYEKDNNRPDAWRYRDWVIDAIQRDMPFDQFTIEQLAGDLLPNRTDDQVLATAFNRQTLTNTEGGTDREQWRVAAVMDRSETVGAVWLGLTVGCARCHNHKYDQISQKEYYELYAYFDNADETNVQIPRSEQAVRAYEIAKAKHDQAGHGIKKALADARRRALPDMSAWEERVRTRTAQATEEPEAESEKVLPDDLAAIVKQEKTERRSDDQRKLEDNFLATHSEYLKAKKTFDAHVAAAPKSPMINARVMVERSDNRRQTHILRRGEFKQKLDPVGNGTLASVTAQAEPASRLAFAQWLVDARNPIVPRVSANHIWDHLFGHGLVRTVNDFGVRGEQPTHPELLDWLAGEYIRLGWSRKELIKTIVMSATYRQKSNHRVDVTESDPNNYLLSRQNRFRLEAEAMRDSFLAVAGLLSYKVGGESVFPPIPSGITDLNYNSSFKWKTSKGEDRFRRGMYTYFKRTAPHPNLTTLDCPDSNVTCVKRDRSNTPLAALITLNNAVFHEAAQALTHELLLSDTLKADGERLAYAIRRCVARPAEIDEVATLSELLGQSRQWYADHAEDSEKVVGGYALDDVPIEESAAWVATLRMVLNLDEFVTRE